MKLDEIIIGDRVRKEMGDIKSLAASIAQRGLLHPIVVKPDRTLVAGARRIAAARLLGWTEIAATVIDVADLLGAERDENAERKDFTPTEAVAIGRLIEEEHRQKIAAVSHDRAVLAGLKRHGLDPAASGKTKRGNDISAAITNGDVGGLGQSDAVAAEAIGMPRSSYYRAKKVVAAAEADPEKFGDLPARMDETGNVSGTHREMVARQNGTPQRHPIHYRHHHPKADDMIRRALIALEGLLLAVGEIDPREANKDEAREWACAFTKAAVTLRRFARELTK